MKQNKRHDAEPAAHEPTPDPDPDCWPVTSKEYFL